MEAAEDVRFLIVNGSSRPVKLARLDLGVAAKVLGYVPQDTWPEGM